MELKSSKRDSIIRLEERMKRTKDLKEKRSIKNLLKRMKREYFKESL